jgi:hypothetical protein
MNFMIHTQRIRLFPGLIMLWMLLVACQHWAQGQEEAVSTLELPKLDEIRGILAENLPHLSRQDIDHAALQGILTEFQDRVELSPAPEHTDQPSSSLSRKEWLEQNLLYLRFHRLAKGSSEEIITAFRDSPSPTPSGLIVDLRYCQDDDYRALSELMRLFIDEPMTLPDFGWGLVGIDPDASGVGLPVVMLINQATRGGAEVFAYLMQKAGKCVLVGKKTAGRTLISQSFNLSTGQVLKLSTKAVTDQADHPLLEGGCAPDILVNVSDSDQAAWFDNPYWNPSQSGSTADSDRLNEAELMRRQRERQGDTESKPEVDANALAQEPLIRDPILARGIDILKGWSILAPQTK